MMSSSPQARQPLLDVFRGFAVFGIFFVNITIMHSMMMFQDGYYGQFTDSLSGIVQRVLQLFFYNKFFPIFSFLFGLGISMQMLAKIEKRQGYVTFFSRRMALLFVIGIGHISFFWSGDVVHLYALLGLLCLILIKLPPKVLVAVATILLVFPYYDYGARWFSQLFEIELEHALISLGDSGVSQIYQSGSYEKAIALRWDEYLANVPMLLFYLAPMALSMFLFGIAAGKAKTQFANEAWVQQFKKLAVFTLITTTIYRVFFLWWLPDLSLYQEESLKPVWFKLMFLSDISFGLLYLWVIAWLWHHGVGQRFLALFSYVGRMALTNYLVQSVIGMLLFTSAGFSLYQSLSPSECFLIALVVFVLQALYSKAWLSHFRYGPIEWLWRCGSYKSVFPILIRD